jgi:hypothetical protein
VSVRKLARGTLRCLAGIMLLRQEGKRITLDAIAQRVGLPDRLWVDMPMRRLVLAGLVEQEKATCCAIRPLCRFISPSELFPEKGKRSCKS